MLTSEATLEKVVQEIQVAINDFYYAIVETDKINSIDKWEKYQLVAQVPFLINV